MSEQKRGCGYRKIGGLYLVCDSGAQLVCDGLPLDLEPCSCCGFEPPFSRNLQKISWQYVKQAEHRHHMKQEKENPEHGYCSCPEMCPICNPEAHSIQGINFGLMFVGKKFYTPESFIKEAQLQGISKRIPEIPNWLKLGETWIFLAHDEVPKVSLEQLKNNGMHMKEPETSRAIFYGFKPQRVEMPVWKGELTDEQIRKLEEKGITLVLLDPTTENKKKHGYAKRGLQLEKYLEDL